MKHAATHERPFPNATKIKGSSGHSMGWSGGRRPGHQRCFHLLWLTRRYASRILQTIASGVLGVASFKSGLKSAALGAILHFFIALTAAATYYAASRKVPLLTKRPVIYGLLYGVAVYLFMNLIVVPLSAVPKFPVSTTALINGILAIMFFIGLPNALIVRHYSESMGRKWRDLTQPPVLLSVTDGRRP